MLRAEREVAHVDAHHVHRPLEYRAEDPEVNIKPHHKMTQAQAIKEMAAVGLQHVKTVEDLPQQHLMVFEKK